MPARGDVIEVEIERAAFEGRAVARVDGLVIFVAWAVPGDRARVRMTRRKRRYAEAVVEEIVRPSPIRTEPRCPHFATCGGCTLQNVEYAKQLEFKQQQVVELLDRIGGFRGVEVLPVLPSPVPYYYRNKMEFTFGSQRWLSREEIDSGQRLERDFALGLHISGRFDRILDLRTCFLQSPRTVELLDGVRRLVRRRGWSAYDVRSHEGYLRNLVIRNGVRTEEWMVNLVTRTEDEDRMRWLSDRLCRDFDFITTFVNSIYPGKAGLARGEKEIVYRGPGFIRERIGELAFRISPACFFQPNTLQAERLFQVLDGMAALQGEELVYDLYCGAGAISLFLAGKAGSVVGVESHEESVRLARENAALNGISNCEFHAGDVRDLLKGGLGKGSRKPDVVIVDPPRAGLHEKALAALLELRPRRIVYSSCNPATQARDLKRLAESYRIEAVQPVDMFPQTWHIENVVLLEVLRS